MISDIHDIRPPVDLPSIPWLLYLSIFIVLSIIIAGCIQYIRYRRALALKKAEIRLSAWEVAYQELNQLQEGDLMQQTNVKEYYIQLSEVIRRYMENRFGIRASEMTTEEFLDFLKTAQALSETQKESLKRFMNHCDMVKFAKYPATLEEMQESFQLARQLIDETKGLSS
ncbi:MAG: DUF4381 family protein [Candidatus Omnitrophica bacterium]|nr:DUF4381 family protein [Candidatus Omnitrophota bacterium]